MKTLLNWNGKKNHPTLTPLKETLPVEGRGSALSHTETGKKFVSRAKLSPSDNLTVRKNCQNEFRKLDYSQWIFSFMILVPLTTSVPFLAQSHVSY